MKKRPKKPDRAKWVDHHGHDGSFGNPVGQLVKTPKFQWFQDDLRRFHPALGLCFDRLYGWYAIYREDNVVEGFDFDDIEEFGAYQRVPAIVFHIRKPWHDPQFPLPRWDYTPPADWVLRRLGAFHPDQLLFDNTGWVEKAIKRIEEETYQAEEKEHDEKIADALADYKTSVSKTNPTWNKTHHTVTIDLKAMREEAAA